MLDKTDQSLLSLVENRRKGYSLDAPFYTSPEIFKTDLEAIFASTWVYVGVEPDVPEAGDTMVVEVAGRSVIIARDDDNNIQAYHNVCRHRGARILLDYKQTVGKVVCRYHSWTYELDGSLIHASHMNPDFDKGCHGLKKVHIRSLEGLLFICLADNPPQDFDEMAKAMAPYIKPHDVPNTKVAFEMDIIEQGNWKLTMENNRECYHCAGNHPELTIPLFGYGFGYSPDQMSDEEIEGAKAYDCLVETSHTEWEAAGFPSRTLEHLDDMVTGYRTSRLPLAGDGEAHTLDTKSACKKLLGTITNSRLGALHFWTQPNSWHHFMADHIVTFSAIPLNANQTLLRTKWLVHKDAVEGVDYDVEKLTEVWKATNDQDGALVGYTQAGALSPAYEPGPYSPYTEGLVEAFCNWYIQRLKDHLA